MDELRAAAAADGRNMNQCKACNAPLMGGARFCSKCGAPVGGMPPPYAPVSPNRVHKQKVNPWLFVLLGVVVCGYLVFAASAVMHTFERFKQVAAHKIIELDPTEGMPGDSAEDRVMAFVEYANQGDIVAFLKSTDYYADDTDEEIGRELDGVESLEERRYTCMFILGTYVYDDDQVALVERFTGAEDVAVYDFYADYDRDGTECYATATLQVTKNGKTELLSMEANLVRVNGRWLVELYE